ncbi:MAG: hypothetical protein J1E83_14280 [Lachnospiraceae bacterium]|nr:hypothetical protein [Lachnospiraceae bacterium]
MTSLLILEFKQTIQKYVQETTLPDEVKRMILADILREQETVTYETLKQEITERDKNEQEENKNEESI